MKNLTYFLIFAMLVFVSCEKKSMEHKSDFEESYRAWQSFKIQSKDSYRYKVTDYTWTGSRWTTTITVEKGKIIGREFYYSTWNSVPRPEEGWNQLSISQFAEAEGLTESEFDLRYGTSFLESLEWKETQELLGMHTRSPASDLNTLDDIYALARSNWLNKRSNSTVYFETENNGMISTAGYAPSGCMDDCFVGITISSVEPLN